jgi:hypothetical protein
MFIEINSNKLGRELIAVDRPIFKMLRILREHFEQLGYAISGNVECDNRRWIGEYQATSSSDELTIAVI